MPVHLKDSLFSGAAEGAEETPGHVEIVGAGAGGTKVCHGGLLGIAFVIDEDGPAAVGTIVPVGLSYGDDLITPTIGPAASASACMEKGCPSVGSSSLKRASGDRGDEGCGEGSEPEGKHGAQLVVGGGRLGGDGEGGG